MVRSSDLDIWICKLSLPIAHVSDVLGNTFPRRFVIPNHVGKANAKRTLLDVNAYHILIQCQERYYTLNFHASQGNFI